MGLRGPQHKPTAIRKMEGNPSKRRFNEREPQYGPELPDRPAGMTAGAKKFWDGLVGDLLMARVLTRVDGLALGHLCENLAELHELRLGMQEELRIISEDRRFAAKVLAAENAVVEEARRKKPRRVSRPALEFTSSSAGRRVVTRIKELDAMITVQLREFGLSPASRSRVESLPMRPVVMTGSAAEPSRPPMDAIETALCSAKTAKTKVN